MAAAARVMTASGFGDLMGKVPASADWMIADALGIEPIEPDVWELVQARLRPSLARPDLLAVGDVGAISQLAEGLVMSGLAIIAAPTAALVTAPWQAGRTWVRPVNTM